MSCTRQEQNGRSSRTYPQIANHNVGVHARTRENRHNGSLPLELDSPRRDGQAMLNPSVLSYAWIYTFPFPLETRVKALFLDPFHMLFLCLTVERKKFNVDWYIYRTASMFVGRVLWRDQSESSVTIYGVIEDPQKAQKHSLKESYKELTRNVGDFSNNP
ncbi:hypothetical protein NC651_017727 [Populus alba x Populus x berolinensis]|nr:hypothetical protein NC651_017727 [Populus alba x Populus x berolinensis]